MSNQVKSKISLLILALSVCLAPLSSPVSVLADNAYVQIIQVTRVLDGSSDAVTVWNHPNWVNRTVEFDEGTDVTIEVYAAAGAGGGTPIYWHLWSDQGVDIERTTSNWYEEFSPNPDQGDYFAWVDGNTPGEFYLDDVSTGECDLTVSQPRPDNGSTNPPFCVGQSVDWYVTLTNIGGADCPSCYVGYYLGTSSSDYSNRVNSDLEGPLPANGGSDDEHDAYTFVSADAGTRYMNAWVDYEGEIPEEDDNNNKSSYGPFQVNNTLSPPSLSSPGNGSSTCDATPTFSWSSVSGATSYRIQVDNDSNFSSPIIDSTTGSTNYTPGSNLPTGSIYWRVLAHNACGDGTWSSPRSFTVLSTPNSPSLISPGNGSSTCDATPTFSWSGVSGATSYRIQVDNDSNFGSPIIDTTDGSTSYTPGSNLPTGPIYWRVLASNSCGEGSWSSAWNLSILATPGAPALSSPSNGSIIGDSTPSLTWGSISGATSYDIQVDDDSGFGSPAVDETVATTSHTASALVDDTYYWHARAKNTCGEGPWSAAWNFTIETECPTPNPPSLSSPADGDTVSDRTPAFSWSSVSGATSYRIQVDDSSDFGSPEIDTTTSNASYTPGSDMALDTYYWRVQASNTCGSGSWSAVWDFTIDTDCTLPSPPSLSSPADGVTLLDRTPTFSWNGVSGAESYRMQVDDDSGFGSPAIDTTASGTSYTPPLALEYGTYYWHAQASNICGDGPWSSPVRSLTIAPDSEPGGPSTAYLPFVTSGDSVALVMPPQSTDADGKTLIHLPEVDVEVTVVEETWNTPLEDIQIQVVSNGEKALVLMLDPQGNYYPQIQEVSFATLVNAPNSGEIAPIVAVAIVATVAYAAYNIHQFAQDLPSVQDYGLNWIETCWTPAQMLNWIAVLATPAAVLHLKAAAAWKGLAFIAGKFGGHLALEAAADNLWCENEWPSPFIVRFTTVNLLFPILQVTDNFPLEGCDIQKSTCPPNTGHIYGTVTDATSGQPISGAYVDFPYRPSISDFTDREGFYSIHQAPAGPSTVRVACDGCAPASDVAMIPDGGEVRADFSVSPIVDVNKIRAVLTWGTSPSDLDLHLWLPESNPYHIYYHDKGSIDRFPWAELDHDDTDQLGPETITLWLNRVEGKYTLAVHRFSSSGSLSTSNATVSIYHADQTLTTFNVGDAQGSGTWWYLADLVPHQTVLGRWWVEIDEVNRLQDYSPR